MSVRILVGDALTMLRTLESESVQMIGPTSPPYLGLRSYLPAGHPDKAQEIGQEATPDEFIEALVAVFREARRVLRPDGIFVLNLGDSYAGSGKGPTGHNGIGDQAQRQGFTGYGPGHQVGRMNGTIPTQTSQKAPPGLKPKDLMMVPFRVAMALQADGWYLRSVMPWLKRNSMPESVNDRPATSVEYLFLLSKARTYYWDAEAIRAPLLQPDVKVPQGLSGHKRNGGTTYSGNAYDASQLGGRTRRNGDWFFESWQGLMLDEAGDPLALVVNPRPLKEAHFASFPPTLVEPFIRAGTSEKGACPSCGSPWVRMVEREPGFQARRQFEDGMRGRRTGAAQDADYRGVGYTRAETTGWAPSCACPPADPVPQVVIDPFLGSGTTALVADRLGRDAIGIELNETYAALARERIERDAGGLFGDPVAVERPVQPSLLGAEEGVAS